jgi:hypothetical protein
MEMDSVAEESDVGRVRPTRIGAILELALKPWRHPARRAHAETGAK